LLYLTLPYQAFTKKIIPLTRSLPLILHYIPQLQQHFHEFFTEITSQSTTQNSGLDGVLLLYEKFFETVLDEGVGCAEQAVEDLFRIGAINGLEAALIEKTYSTASQVFKLLSSALLTADSKATKTNSTKSLKRKKKAAAQVETVSPEARLEGIWKTCKAYLSKQMKPHVRSCAAKVWAVLLRRARGQPMRNMVVVMVQNLDDEDAVEGLAAALSEGLKVSIRRDGNVTSHANHAVCTGSTTFAAFESTSDLHASRPSPAADRSTGSSPSRTRSSDDIPHPSRISYRDATDS
jgi:hypothetical protein